MPFFLSILVVSFVFIPLGNCVNKKQRIKRNGIKNKNFAKLRNPDKRLSLLIIDKNKCFINKGKRVTEGILTLQIDIRHD